MHGAVVVATLALVVAACSETQPASSSLEPTATASPSPSPTATPSPRAALVPGLDIPADWTAIERHADGFAVGLPPRWRQIDLDPQTLEASTKAIEDPQFAAILRSQAQSLITSGLKLFAFDFTPGASARPDTPRTSTSCART